MSFSKFAVSNVSNNFFTHIKGKRDAADFTRDVICYFGLMPNNFSAWRLISLA